MTRSGFGLGLALLFSTPVMADGPALAHLTIHDRTITLTAVETPPTTNGLLTLSFAQHHLGFPLPPRLSVTLQDQNGTWALSAFALERDGTQPPLAFGTLQVFHDAGPPERFVIDGDSLAPGPQTVPIHVEITLRSP